METKRGPGDMGNVAGNFLIKGNALLEEMERFPEDVQLAAYAFSPTGLLLGEGKIDKKGEFSLGFNIQGAKSAQDVQLVIGPEGKPDAVRKSSAYKRLISAKEWAREGDRHVLVPKLSIPRDVWLPWQPTRICISGHVRKLHDDDVCPVPFVKVEIFDVDREPCWWPHLTRWWDVLLDRRAFRIPDLLEDRKIEVGPIPGPDPAPALSSLARPDRALTALPIRTRPEPLSKGVIGVSRQHEVHEVREASPAALAATFERVGEARAIDPAVATRLDHLTLSSRIAPWVLFPSCFYSTRKVGEATTDENGYFDCCFRWWPFHFRFGRLRYDARPDILIKVTQNIDGVERVVYLDPYTSTRWNVSNAHIDLYLDDPSIRCGSGEDQPRPPGRQAFLTRVGDDEVYRIDQASGLYGNGATTNVAYGELLALHAQFGDDLSDGSPARYYRLSHARHGSPDSAFTPLTAPLADVRVNKATNFSESYSIGPKTVNGMPALYEIRNARDYLWYNPDLIGYWHSQITEPDTGKYVLRLEVFDENGNKLGSPVVDYRDGTAPPNSVLPAMIDHADLVITLDNKPPELDLITPAINDCGVIPGDSLSQLNLQVKVTQENNRLFQWRLDYVKGAQSQGAYQLMARAASPAGALSPVNVTVDAMHYPNPGLAPPSHLDMLANVTSTCAFALRLGAWPNIRNGRHFVYYREVIQAIAGVKDCDCE
jgi:hypothetical protein